MLQSTKLLFVLSLLVLCMGCSDPSSDPHLDEKSMEIAISNPVGSEPVSGEVTMAVEGNIPHVSDQLRLYVGDELLESIDNPQLPNEVTFSSYDFNNGEYDLRAELDVAEQDTSIETSVSATFENYLLTMETGEYISDLKESYENAYLFIADPDGNVLREMELTAESDGTFNILPPGAIEGEAPSNYSFTIGGKSTNDQGEQQFSLTTDVGLESWKTIQINSPSGRLTGDEPTTSELTVTMENFDRDPRRTWFFWEQYPYGGNALIDHQDGPLNVTLDLPDDANELFITHHPNWETESNLAPSYIHQENPGELGNSVTYDVTEDFSKMQSQAVSVPSEIELNYYALFMTIAPDSFDDGDMGILWGYPDLVGDANGEDSGFGIWTPGSEVLQDHSFITYMQAVGSDGSLFRYQTDILNGFPDEFKTVETDLQVQNWSLDNLEIDASEEADYKLAFTESSSGEWRAFLPADQESFTYPKIADSLDQSVTSYNRSDFTISFMTYTNRLDYDGYSDYLSDNFGDTDFGYDGNWTQMTIYNSSSSKAKTVPGFRQSDDTKTSGESSYRKLPKTLFPGH